MSTDDQPSFSAELTRLRVQRGWSKKKLAAEMGFDASYLSHVEAGRMHASDLFASKADEALGAQGELIAAWRRGNGGTDAAGVSFPGGHMDISGARAVRHQDAGRLTTEWLRVRRSTKALTVVASLDPPRAGRMPSHSLGLGSFCRSNFEPRWGIEPQTYALRVRRSGRLS